MAISVPPAESDMASLADSGGTEASCGLFVASLFRGDFSLDYGFMPMIGR